jgi:hypothetical protein
MLKKLNKITKVQASIIIAFVGLAIFFTGLTSPFQGDDNGQIVNNIPVHSITNIKLFFEGGTFYVGNGLSPLYGLSFRPLMTTVFSFIYTVFGAHPIYFHLFQMLLCIGSAIILYLIFRYSFKPALALFLSLIFLVHPINSQVTFAIPSTQDALFFFFGILAVWLLIRFKSVKSLLLVALCLFLSLLSKETGVLFLVFALLYLVWFDRKRLYSFLGIMVLPIALYIVLRINAVGVITNPNAAPVDNLGLGERLLTAPSILLFYITKFLLPIKLASAYYWTYSTFSFLHVFIPTVIDILVALLIIYPAFVIRRRSTKAQFYTYLFFMAWFWLGILFILQISPLDMTASESWFYFPMVGMLGMIGVFITSIAPHKDLDPKILLAVAIVIILALGIRTAVRGTDWSNQYTLAYNDIKVSSDDFNAYDVIAVDLYNHDNFLNAKYYIDRSIAIYPTDSSYGELGLIDINLHDYSGAELALSKGLEYGANPQLHQQIYDNAARVMIWYGKPSSNLAFVQKGLSLYPQDSNLWLIDAILEYHNGNTLGAKNAISQAYELSQNTNIAEVYQVIMNNQQLIINQP